MALRSNEYFLKAWQHIAGKAHPSFLASWLQESSLGHRWLQTPNKAIKGGTDTACKSATSVGTSRKLEMPGREGKLTEPLWPLSGPKSLFYTQPRTALWKWPQRDFPLGMFFELADCTLLGLSRKWQAGVKGAVGPAQLADTNWPHENWTCDLWVQHRALINGGRQPQPL